MNIKSLKQAFHTRYNNTTPNFNRKIRDISRLLVSKYSSGNINLQSGRFSTETDINKRRDEVCDYRFAD